MLNRPSSKIQGFKPIFSPSKLQSEEETTKKKKKEMSLVNTGE